MYWAPHSLCARTHTSLRKFHEKQMSSAREETPAESIVKEDGTVSFYLLSTFLLSSLLVSFNVPFFKMSPLLVSLFSLDLQVQMEPVARRVPLFAFVHRVPGRGHCDHHSCPLPAELVASEAKGMVFPGVSVRSSTKLG